MKKILKQITAVFLIFYIIVFILFSLGILDSPLLHSTYFSGLINLINTALAITAFYFGINQPNKKFLIYVLGSMIARMFFILICVFIVLKFTKINEYGFIFSLFIVYFVALVFEINFYRLKINEKKN